jgi:hypothetical protein
MCTKGAVPCRTIKALVKAAKVMVIAARPTQMPVLAGGGEEFLTWRKSPLAGVKFRQPPLPEPWLGEGSRSIFGGSWTVVAILLLSSGKEASQTRDYWVADNPSVAFALSGQAATLRRASLAQGRLRRAARPDPSLRKKRLLRITITSITSLRQDYEQSPSRSA